MKLFSTLTTSLLAALTILPNTASSQATNQPKLKGVDAGVYLFDNMIYHNFEFANPLSTEQYMFYKTAECYLTKHPKATYAGMLNDKDVKAFIKKYNITHVGGPMLGNVRTDGVDVWVRTVNSEVVTVKVKTPKGEKVFKSTPTLMENDYSVVVSIDGLKPDSEYSYQVFADDKEIVNGSEFKFKTLPATAKSDMRIVFGADYHRYGLGHVELANTMLSRSAYAFLAIGDIAAQDENNNVGFHALDYLSRDLYSAWQNLVSKLPVYATWDDHDYFDDDKRNVPYGYDVQDKENVWRMWKNSWVNPSYGFGDTEKGIFLRTRIGSVDILMLDGRYFREFGSFLGKKQTEWLKEQLLDCDGDFKIISCGTMFSDYVSKGKDSWGRYDPKTRQAIFDLIEENEIPGVLLISGDRHGSRGFTIEQPSGYKFYEFGSGSLGGLGGQPARTDAWKDVQLYGESEMFAFGEFEFDTKIKDPTVTFRLIKAGGEEMYKLTLSKSQLTPQKK